MLVRIEDLRKGDVVLLGGAKGLFEAKLLRQPMLAKTGKLTTWYGTPRWSTVLCAVREETITRNYTYGNGQIHKYDYTQAVVADGKDYTKEKRINFTDAQLWLIKREEL